jgi:hypothetical protein
MKRRNLLALIGASPAMLAGARAEAQATTHKKAAAKAKAGAPAIIKDYGGVRVEAINPRGTPPPIQLIPMAPRLTTLDGKTIYLVSDGFPGADHFLDQIGIWFKKNMPSVTTQYRLKKGGFADDDPELWAEIKSKGNAVIMAIGH